MSISKSMSFFLEKTMSQRKKNILPAAANEAPTEPEVKLRVAGGSYAGIIKRLPHPHGPCFEMMAKGLVELLATNHFDAAVAVVHNLADLMDDYQFRVKNNEPG